MNVPPLLHRTRRHFFQDCGIGVGKIALASLLAKESFGATGKPDFMRFPDQGQAGDLSLFMAGAPSQLELFDRQAQAQGNGGQAHSSLRDQGSTLRFYPAGRRRSRTALSLCQARRFRVPNSRIGCPI